MPVDSTGFSTKNSSKWFDIRMKRQINRKEYLKSHIAVDVHTGFIHQFSITDGTSHDSPLFESLIK
ncbi:MAG: transposase [Candidatus Saliniplasma sp.]